MNRRFLLFASLTAPWSCFTSPSLGQFVSVAALKRTKPTQSPSLGQFVSVAALLTFPALGLESGCPHRWGNLYPLQPKKQRFTSPAFFTVPIAGAICIRCSGHATAITRCRVPIAGAICIRCSRPSNRPGQRSERPVPIAGAICIRCSPAFATSAPTSTRSPHRWGNVYPLQLLRQKISNVKGLQTRACPTSGVLTGEASSGLLRPHLSA